MPGDPHPALMDYQDERRRKRVRAAKKRANEIINDHRTSHNVMAGHYWMELAETFKAEMVRMAEGK